jgi:tryptophan synthase alpha chain
LIVSTAKLADIIEASRRRDKLALIPFLPAAFPDGERFWETAMELAQAGADILEIGVPFSDPVADGPVVAAASQRAWVNGGNLDYIIAGLSRRRSQLPPGLVLMGYANPFVQYAWKEAAAGATDGLQGIMDRSLGILGQRLAAVGVQGLIVPDLPLEESALWLNALKPLELIPLVGPNTSLERMRLYAQNGHSGYVYVVSIMGTTGVRGGLPPEAAAALLRARQAFNLPLALGFGLSSREQISALAPSDRPEAVVFGSALIECLDKGGSAAGFMARF